MRVFTLTRIVILVVVLLLAAAIWFGGPYLTIYDVDVLESVGSRVLAVLCLFALWGFWEGYRLWRRQRLRRQLLERMTADDNTPLGRAQAQEEVDALRAAFETAVAALSQTPHIGLRDRHRMLYDQPWYLVIGAPGSGKTALLRQSELNFPLADRMGIDFSDEGEGTQLPQLLFTDHGVLVDTPGRLVVRSENVEAEVTLWRALIELLIEYRWRQPINGIIVTLSLEDAQTLDEAALQTQIHELRTRLSEVVKRMQMDLPAYLVLTKADRIAGFAESFERLSQEERQQVWGITFEPGRKSGPTPNALKRELQALIQRLAAWVNGRVRSDAERAHAAEALAFPVQLQGLLRKVLRHAERLRHQDRFSVMPRLRGLYLTSARQDGKSVNMLFESLAAGGARGYAPADPPTQDQGYFINGLLKSVIFSEANLTAPAPGYRRARGLRFALLAAIGLFGLGFAFLVDYAFHQSAEEVVEIDAALQTYQTGMLNLPGRPLVSDLVQPLSALKLAAREADTDLIIPPLFGLDLTPRHTLRTSANEAYDRFLLAEFLPAIRGRLSNGLENALANDAAPGTVRKLLELYLMLGRPDRFDSRRFSEWADSQWQLLYPLDAERRGQLSAATADLMTLMPVTQALDQPLVERTRDYLLQVPRAADIYGRLKQIAARSAEAQSVDFVRELGVNGLAVLNIGGAARVPGLYTRDGFYKIFLTQTPQLISQEFSSDWIFEGTQPKLTDDTTRAILQEVADSYAEDYIQAWEKALAAVSLRQIPTLDSAVRTAEILGGNDSPLVVLFGLISRNTDLTAPPLAQRDEGSGGQGGGLTAALRLDREFAIAALTAVGADDWPGTTIGLRFAAYRTAVQGDGGPATPLRKAQDGFAATYGDLNAIAAAADVGEAAAKRAQSRFQGQQDDPLSTLAVNAVGQPAPLREVMRGLVSASWRLILAAARSYVDERWRQEVLPSCSEMIANRYPLYADATQPIRLEDFATFFGPDGILDGFVTGYLDPYLDREGRIWRQRQVGGYTLGLQEASLAQLRAGLNLAQTFFVAGSGQVDVKFSVTPDQLDPAAERVVMKVAGQEIVYRHGPLRTEAVSWPGLDGSESASVVVTNLQGKNDSLERTGPWAMFRLFEEGGLQATAAPDRYYFSVSLGTGAARFLIDASSVSNPFDVSELRSFRCPSSL